MIVKLVDLILLLDFCLSFVLRAYLGHYHIYLYNPVLYSKSVESGTLPRDWVTANIVPVHKKGDRCVASNYRPISLTSVVKIMERIANTFTNYYMFGHIFYMFGHILNHQYGFCRHHSTTH